MVNVYILLLDKVCKIRNHKLNVPGITDSLTVTDELLLSTSYDLDTGIGSINGKFFSDNVYELEYPIHTGVECLN